MLCINKIEAIACIYLISIFYHFSELRVSHGQWHLRIGWQRMWRGLIIKVKIVSTRSSTATNTKKQHHPRNYSGEEFHTAVCQRWEYLSYIFYGMFFGLIFRIGKNVLNTCIRFCSHLTIILEIQKVNGVCNNIFTTILLQVISQK